MKKCRRLTSHDNEEAVMQSLKKNWFLVPKMTWGIWWILSGKSESLHFDVLLLSITKSDPNFEEKLTFAWKMT